MWRLWLLLPIGLIGLAALGQTPPVPTLSAPVLKSPKDAQTFVGQSSVQTQKPTQLQWAWDYPADQLALVNFEFWHTFGLTNGPAPSDPYAVPPGFSLLVVLPGFLGTTTWLSCTNAQEFYILRAVTLDGKMVSPWNQK